MLAFKDTHACPTVNKMASCREIPLLRDTYRLSQHALRRTGWEAEGAYLMLLLLHNAGPLQNYVAAFGMGWMT
jgi:hypothetical protein